MTNRRLLYSYHTLLRSSVQAQRSGISCTMRPLQKSAFEMMRSATLTLMELPSIFPICRAETPVSVKSWNLCTESPCRLANSL